MADDFITRADVVEEIKKICQNCLDTCAVFDGLTPDCESGCGIFELRSKVTAIPAADVRPVEWISVKDKLPQEFQSVWAACKAEGRENWTIETVYDPYLRTPWGTFPMFVKGMATVYAWMDRSDPDPPREEDIDG